MKKYKYIAYDAGNDEDVELFETFEEAEKWLMPKNTEIGLQEGVRVINGYIAKITHETGSIITKKRKDYTEEQWPYGNQYKIAGEIVLKEVTLKEKKEGPGIIHGKTCVKKNHVDGINYFHDVNSDGMCNVDGILYCGRCHRAVENHQK